MLIIPIIQCQCSYSCGSCHSYVMQVTAETPESHGCMIPALCGAWLQGLHQAIGRAAYLVRQRWSQEISRCSSMGSERSADGWEKSGVFSRPWWKVSKRFTPLSFVSFRYAFTWKNDSAMSKVCCRCRLSAQNWLTWRYILLRAVNWVNKKSY